MQNVQEKSGISKLVIVATVVAVVLVAALALFYVSLGSSPSAGTNITCGSSTPSGSAVQVSITSGAANVANAPGYSPDKITLMIGTNNTLTWTNKDSVHRTVSTSAAPAGASFDSGNMDQGATYTCTFTTPGTYQYYCKCHSWMTGTIVVVS